MQLIEKVKNWLGQDHNALKLAVLPMMAIGAIFIYLVGPFSAARIGQDPNFFFIRYVPFLAFGIGVLIMFSTLSKKWILRICRIWLIIGCAMILMTLVNPYMVGGAARYVELFGFLLDPFAMTLPPYIVMMSYWLGKERTRKSDRSWACTWITALTAALVFIAFRAPYIMMGVIYLAVFVIMAHHARKTMPELRKISTTLALATVAIILFAYLTMSPVHQYLYALMPGSDYATRMSARTINAASLIGTNAQALKYLHAVPSLIYDYAVTGIIARFGICALALLLALYYWVAGQMRRNSKTAQDSFYALLNTGVLTLFVGCILFSLMISFGILSTTAYLPMVSYSPTFLISFCALFGVVFSARK